MNYFQNHLLKDIAIVYCHNMLFFIFIQYLKNFYNQLEHISWQNLSVVFYP